MNLRPYKFKPLLKTVIWGGEKIVAFKGIDSELHQVGESWELSGVEGHESVVDGGPDDGLTLTQLIERHGAELVGERVYRKHGTKFPLLVKLIDAQRDLSVQVHPDDEMAQRVHGCSGKTEMWYVIDHEPGAQIMAGFSRDITPDEYDRRVADGTIMDVVRHYSSHRGQVFFLPAGRIHAIGAGNLIAEIQQTSDITYRVFDYNRVDQDGHQRQLHTALARQALTFTASTTQSESSTDDDMLVSCPQFVVCRHLVDGNTDMILPDAFMVMMCIAGNAQIIDNYGEVTTLRCGETTLIPASHTHLSIHGKTTLITAYC